jgi:3-dehydroquinate synthase class II
MERWRRSRKRALHDLSKATTGRIHCKGSAVCADTVSIVELKRDEMMLEVGNSTVTEFWRHPRCARPNIAAILEIDASNTRL